MPELTDMGLAPVDSPALYWAASAKPLVVGLSAAGHCRGSWVTQVSLAHVSCCNPPGFLEFGRETVISGKARAIPGSEIHVEGRGR